VNGLSIRQQNDTQDPILHFGNLSPTTNASIGLDGLARGLPQHTLNPLIMDQRSIRTAAGVEEVLGMLQKGKYKYKCQSSLLTQRQHLLLLRSRLGWLIQQLGNVGPTASM